MTNPTRGEDFLLWEIEERACASTPSPVCAFLGGSVGVRGRTRMLRLSQCKRMNEQTEETGQRRMLHAPGNSGVLQSVVGEKEIAMALLYCALGAMGMTSPVRLKSSECGGPPSEPYTSKCWKGMGWRCAKPVSRTGTRSRLVLRPSGVADANATTIRPQGYHDRDERTSIY